MDDILKAVIFCIFILLMLYLAIRIVQEGSVSLGTEAEG